jgi:predicted thioesterase
VTPREVNGRRSGFDARVVNEDGVVIGEGSH